MHWSACKRARRTPLSCDQSKSQAKHAIAHGEHNSNLHQEHYFLYVSAFMFGLQEIVDDWEEMHMPDPGIWVIIFSRVKGNCLRWTITPFCVPIFSGRVLQCVCFECTVE